jgi:taurine dioxygenase
MSYSVSQLSPTIGAEVVGIDLTAPIPASIRADLNNAVVENKVLAFRNQRLTPGQMLEASTIFGFQLMHQLNDRLGFHTTPENRFVHYITNRDIGPKGARYVPGDGFHIDYFRAVRPPKAIMLFAVELPDKGGDTSFLDLQRAYDDLPDDLKSRLDGRLGISIVDRARPLVRAEVENGDKPHIPGARLHPIVRTHPESGRKALFIFPKILSGIYGMSREEETELLDRLLEHCMQPKYEFRHVWRHGDLVIWDNRNLMHRANADYDLNQTRRLYRIMLAGDVPR